MRLDSDRFPPEQATLEDFVVATYHRPFGGGAASGDRFAVHGSATRLAFYLADASGHGEQGAAFWTDCRADFDAQWDALCATGDLATFARAVNADLFARPGACQLCLTVGLLMADGRLRVVNCGYGTYALVTTGAGPWWPGGASELFGLKLGWVPPASWDTLPRAFVDHVVHDVQRVVLISDGFLGDDYADPEATLAAVRDLGARVGPLPIDQAMAHVRALPHDDDDAAALVIDVGT